jgi:hypothetical protein
MNFKLNYRTSASTTMSTNDVGQRIQYQLHADKYAILQAERRIIKFKDNPWALRWNFSPFKLDGGEFAIDDGQAGEKQVTLKYYVNFLPFILQIIFMFSFILGTGAPIEAILFFLVFFAVAITIENLRARGKAKELLAEVLNANIPPIEQGDSAS